MVCMKFKTGIKEEDIRALERLLEALPSRIVEIHTYEFGRDVVRSERSYDFGLVSLFANEDALQRYQKHPEHRKAAEHIGAICEKVVTVDFDYAYAPSPEETPARVRPF
jgi:hypothetical protein